MELRESKGSPTWDREGLGGLPSAKAVVEAGSGGVWHRPEQVRDWWSSRTISSGAQWG